MESIAADTQTFGNLWGGRVREISLDITLVVASHLAGRILAVIVELIVKSKGFEK
jgi:hypothetical protein